MTTAGVKDQGAVRGLYFLAANEFVHVFLAVFCSCSRFGRAVTVNFAGVTPAIAVHGLQQPQIRLDG